MKLFAKYNRINLMAIISIFVLASAAFFYLINYVVIAQIDDDLKIKQNEIKTYAKEHHRLPESVPVGDQIIHYSLASFPLKHRYFKSLTLFDSLEHDQNLFRQLTFGLNIDGTAYTVEVSKSLEGVDSMVHSILLISFTTILLILTASFLINRIVLKRLWEPFYATLRSIKHFKIKKKEDVSFPKTQIDEFDFMNQTLAKATNQARKEYLILKEFTENASHEMQTPLAVIRSKLDILIQDEDLTESQSKTLQNTYVAIQRLTKLNQSLLLLAKIENRQYEDAATISLKAKLEDKITDFKELWQAQNIQTTIVLDDLSIKMNNELADILLNNLLSNATRHNYQGGKIVIELRNRCLSIGNTSLHPELNKQLLFTRFYKPFQESSSNGLGLSIIKQICDAAGLQIHYALNDGMHVFQITFSNE